MGRESSELKNMRAELSSLVVRAKSGDAATRGDKDVFMQKSTAGGQRARACVCWPPAHIVTAAVLNCSRVNITNR